MKSPLIISHSILFSDILPELGKAKERAQKAEEIVKTIISEDSLKKIHESLKANKNLKTLTLEKDEFNRIYKQHMFYFIENILEYREYKNVSLSNLKKELLGIQKHLRSLMKTFNDPLYKSLIDRSMKEGNFASIDVQTASLMKALNDKKKTPITTLEIFKDKADSVLQAIETILGCLNEENLNEYKKQSVSANLRKILKLLDLPTHKERFIAIYHLNNIAVLIPIKDTNTKYHFISILLEVINSELNKDNLKASEALCADVATIKQSFDGVAGKSLLKKITI